MSIIGTVREGLICAEIIRNPEAIKNYSIQTYAMQMAAVRHSAESLKWIKTPYPQVIETAIKLNPKQIQYVEDQYLYAEKLIEKRPYALQYIKEENIGYIDENILIKAVSSIGNLIQYIKNPSYRVMSAAINKNPYDVEYIESVPEELQLVAVSLDPNVIGYIKQPTKKAISRAIRDTGKIHHMLDKKFITIDIALYAIRRNPSLYWSLPVALQNNKDVKNAMIEHHQHMINSFKGEE